MRPRGRQHHALLVGKRQVELRVLAALDIHGRRFVAFETGPDTLNHVFTGRQVVRFKAALLLAHHHEGQMAVCIGELHHGAGNRLAGRVIHHALNDGAIIGRLGGHRHCAESNAGGQISGESL